MRGHWVKNGTGNHQFGILAFLAKFGNEQTPIINLAGRCDPDSNGCTRLSPVSGRVKPKESK